MAVNSKTYVKHVYANGRHYQYTYNYSHTESISEPHIKKTDATEWFRCTKTERHVFIEDVSKRIIEVIDPSVISRAGRPKGSKDSYQRTRRTKNELGE